MNKKRSTPKNGTDDGYKIGYKNPPKHTQYPKGQSGNSKGRPKGTKNLKTDLIEELGERITVREGERAQQVSKQRAVVKTMLTRTLKGDARAASLLLSMMMRLLDTGEVEDGPEYSLNENELELLRTYGERLQGQNEGHSTPRGADNRNEDA